MAMQTVKECSGGIAAAVSGGEASANGVLLPKTTNDNKNWDIVITAQRE